MVSDQDTGLRHPLADLAGGGQPVQPGHRNVHDDDVRAQSDREFDRLESVGGPPDHGEVVLGLEQRGQPVAEHRVVVGDQHPDRAVTRRTSIARLARAGAPPGPGCRRPADSRPAASAAQLGGAFPQGLEPHAGGPRGAPPRSRRRTR